MHVELKPMHNADDGRVWFAQIDGGPQFPIIDHAMQTDVDGNATLSLVLSVDSLSIGGKPATTAPPAEESKVVQVWGAPGQKDPREGLPGWEPEKLGEQVARGIREQIQRSGGILA